MNNFQNKILFIYNFKKKIQTVELIKWLLSHLGDFLRY